MTPADTTEARLAGELARVRRSLRRRAAASVGLAVGLVGLSVVLLVAADRSGRWAEDLRRGSEPRTVPALLVARPGFSLRGTNTNTNFELLLTLPGRRITIDHVGADPYIGRSTVDVWIDPDHPDRVATAWDASDVSHRWLLTLGATAALTATLFAAWHLRTTALMAWAARRHGLGSGYVVDVRTEGGDLTPTAPRSLVLVHGEDEPYTAGSWHEAPASGWATMSGPGRWRVLAAWGRRPRLVHRPWFGSTPTGWHRTFGTP